VCWRARAWPVKASGQRSMSEQLRAKLRETLARQAAERKTLLDEQKLDIRLVVNPEESATALQDWLAAQPKGGGHV
jgi:hypothetical protein